MTTYRPLFLVVLVSVGLPGPTHLLAQAPRRGFDLLAARNVLLTGNRVQCNVADSGELCVDPNNSPSSGGGFWPAGTTDQYVFNGGFQIAGIIRGTETSSFPWPSDTVGAFFFDERGDQRHGTRLSGIFDSRQRLHLARWPDAALATDPALYHPTLLGRASVSDQDTWLRYWDGNTSLTNGRVHPAGILVDSRTLSFNRPGLEDAVFFVVRFINISAYNAAEYQLLASAGYDAAAIAEIAAIGEGFHRQMEDTYGIEIPDGGYVLDSLYIAFSQDPDVGQAGANYSNGNLVFGTSLAYRNGFQEPTWQFPLEIFAPPLAQAPGIVANALLRAPPLNNAPLNQPASIHIISNLTGGAPFPAPVGVQRLWRNISGNLLPTDGSCSFVGAQKARHFCSLTQVVTDTRFFYSLGPTTLAPGQSALLVMAQVHAAPVAAAVAPFVGGNLTPGFPIEGARLVQGLDTVRTIDRVAGWVSHADVNANGQIEAEEVITTPRSLYWKIQAARAAIDAGFLAPSAPEPPRSFALPGDNRATIVWQKSATETTGDPYFTVASNPASPLYDPDFRSSDVEGYRVWRGRTAADMRVIVEFDHAGTSFTDHTGQVGRPGSGHTCAPELSVLTGCPTFPIQVPLAGDLVQFRLGDRLLLQGGAVGILHADTALTGGGSGLAPLRDTGVPFVYIDTTVRNGERWYYGVTAFDVNSARSGLSSMESPLSVHAVTPRVPSSNVQPAVIVTGVFGDDGTQLDVGAPFPPIDAARGTFSGTIPPTNAGAFRLAVHVSEVLPVGDYVVRIDSTTSGAPASIGTVPRMYLTFTAPQAMRQYAIDLPLFSHGDIANSGNRDVDVQELVPFDSARAFRAGMPPALAGSGTVPALLTMTFPPIVAGPAATMLCGRGLISTANCGGSGTMQASRYLLHSRWSDEGSPEGPDPTIDFNPSPNQNSGFLNNVNLIWAPQVYRVPITTGAGSQMGQLHRYVSYAMTGFYPADFVVTWGAGGTVTVRDSTHRITLPLARGMGPGYGFLAGADIAAAGITAADLIAGGELGTPDPGIPSYHSLYAIEPVCDVTRPAGGAPPLPCVPLRAAAALQPLDISNPANGVSDGSGIVFVINGEAFFMQMASLPAPGTRWHFRALGGMGLSATCTPALPAGTTALLTPPADCFNYAYTPASTVRPALAPGLRLTIRVAQGFDVTPFSGDLSAVHTVPDPYYLTNSLESGSERRLRFVNLPSQAVIRIYSASGVLVNILSHNDPSGGGEATWDLRSRTGRPVASGVYFYHVETADGRRKVGRFVIVNRD